MPRPATSENMTTSRDPTRSGSSGERYSDSFDLDEEGLELDLLENGTSRKMYHDDESFVMSAEIMETPWGLLSGREKWGRFWYKLWHGPSDPKDVPATFENQTLGGLEMVPEKFRHSLPPKVRIAVGILYLVLWIALIHKVLTPSLTIPPTYLDDGEVKDAVSLSCNSEKSFWKGKNAACGIDGKDCEPFSGREVVFRCPALCDRGSWTYSSIPIGDQVIKYRGYFVGGGKLAQKTDNGELTLPYRSDSFPCGAAIHAGILSPFLGGCARVRYVGPQSKFPSSKGHYGVSDSIEFDSFFPSSFVFMDMDTTWNCYDPRIVVTLINIALGFPVMYLCAGFTAFWIVAVVGFWTICLALDPPVIINVLDPESLPSLISLGLERFLPSLFILYTLWHFSIGNTLRTENVQVAKTLIWYPLFWLGLLNNVTFDRLPVDRLNMSDIREQPGALVAILSIVTTIVVCALIQAYKLWKTGKFRVYFYLYLCFILSLFAISQINGLTLRVHHYILAMLLIPGTGTKGFTAMLFQGLLVGLFLSGASRWGLASIAETSRALRRSDPSGVIKPPTFSGFDNATNVVSWLDQTTDTPGVVDGEIVHPSDGLTGYSLLVNDIERYKGGDTVMDIGALIKSHQDLQQLVDDGMATSDHVTLYLRLARASLSSTKHSDFSRAAKLKWPSGEFTKPEPGVT